MTASLGDLRDLRDLRNHVAPLNSEYRNQKPQFRIQKAETAIRNSVQKPETAIRNSETLFRIQNSETSFGSLLWLQLTSDLTRATALGVGGLP